MTDYDPRRPSGSGLEPMDPNAGMPYSGPAYPPAGTSAYAPGRSVGQQSGAQAYPGPWPTVQLPAQPHQYPAQPQHTPAQQYPAQQYPAQPYPAQPYPAAEQYGQQYSQQYGGVYPSASYAAYPASGWGAPTRPGQVTGAAVLGYIQAGLLIVSALFVFAGASFVNDATNAVHAGDGGITAQFVLAGTANLIAAALFISAGAMFSGGNPSGRNMLVAAIALTAVTALYWVIRFHDGGIVVWAIAFLTMPAIAACLSFGRTVNAWLALPRSR